MSYSMLLLCRAAKCGKRIFGAIDRTSKAAFAELHLWAKGVVAAGFRGACSINCLVKRVSC